MGHNKVQKKLVLGAVSDTIVKNNLQLIQDNETAVFTQMNATRNFRSTLLPTPITLTGVGRKLMPQLDVVAQVSGTRPVLVGLATESDLLASQGIEAGGIYIDDNSVNLVSVGMFGEFQADGVFFSSTLKGVSVPISSGLQQIAGLVTSLGVGTGVGFTSTRLGTGIYSIAFTSAFAVAPAISLTSIGGGSLVFWDVAAIGAGGFGVTCTDTSNTAVDHDFCFTASASDGQAFGGVNRRIQDFFAPSEFSSLHYPQNPGSVTYSFSMYQQGTASQIAKASNIYLFANELF